MFPCQPGGKEPVTRRGFKDASTDPDVIGGWSRWWQRGANVAIATGAPGPDVLDVDNHESGWSALNRLQRAGLLAGAFALIRTRSGGLHVYFAGTGQHCTAKIGGTALDYRSAGGYVIAPPSYVEADAKGSAGRYEVAERRHMTGATFDLGEATALLTPPETRRPTTASSGTGAPDALARWVIGHAQPGYRHEPLRWMVKKLADAGQLDDAGAALVLDVAETIGLDGGQREACQVIRSYGGPA